MTKEGLMRMVVCAGLALTASVMIAGRCAQVSSAALPAQQQGDKPVEQTRKNIKVLKGLPESQLFPLMNFISVSLGVKCGFCHVSQGKDPKTGNTKDRKSTRLNSSHANISYAVFCLKKKNKQKTRRKTLAEQ